jgi:putative ABC transport system permease protein
MDLPGLLEKEGFSAGQSLQGTVDCFLYYNDSAVTGISEDESGAALSLSDYNALMELQGKEELVLDGGNLPRLSETPFCTGSCGFERYVVVPDDMTPSLSVRRQVWSGYYAGDKQDTENALQAAMKELNSDESGMLKLETRLDIYIETMGSKVLVLFVGLYAGMVFLVAAAAVLALQQLTQATDNIPRYRILARLGVEARMRDRSVLSQVALSFFLPLSLAVVHAVVGMKAANAVISQVGRVDSVRNSIITALLLLAVYGTYFLATYWGSRRIVRGNS